MGVFDLIVLIGVAAIVFSKGTLSFIIIHTVVIMVNDISPNDPNTNPIKISALITKPSK
jgi:hypothetical protein